MATFSPVRPIGQAFNPPRSSFFFEDEVDRRIRDAEDEDRFGDFLDALATFGSDFGRGALAGLTFDSGLTGKAPESFGGSVGRFISEAAVVTGLTIGFGAVGAPALLGRLGFARAGAASKFVTQEGLGGALSRFGFANTATGFATSSALPNAAISGALSITGDEDESFMKNLLLFTAMDAIGLGLFAGVKRAIGKGATSSGQDAVTEIIRWVKEGGDPQRGDALIEILKADKTAGDLLTEVQGLGFDKRTVLSEQVNKLVSAFDRRETFIKASNKRFSTELELKFFQDKTLGTKATDAILDTITKELSRDAGILTRAEVDYLKAGLHQVLDTSHFVDDKIISGARALGNRGPEFDSFKSVIDDLFAERTFDGTPGEIVEEALSRLGKQTEGAPQAFLGDIHAGKLTKQDFKPGGRQRIHAENKKRLDVSIAFIADKVDTIRRRTAIGLSPFPQTTGDYAKQLDDVEMFISRRFQEWMDSPAFKRLDDKYFNAVDTILDSKGAFVFSESMDDVIQFARALESIGKMERTATLASAYQQSNRLIRDKQILHTGTLSKTSTPLTELELRGEDLKKLQNTLQGVRTQYNNLQTKITNQLNSDLNKRLPIVENLNEFNALLNAGGDPTKAFRGAGKSGAKEVTKFQRSVVAALRTRIRGALSDINAGGQLSLEFREALAGIADEEDVLKLMMANPKFAIEWFNVTGSRSFKKLFTAYRAISGDEAARREFFGMVAEDTPDNIIAKFNLVSLIHDIDHLFPTGTSIDSQNFGFIARPLNNDIRKIQVDVTDRMEFDELFKHPDISMVSRKFTTIAGIVQKQSAKIDSIVDPDEKRLLAPVKQMFDDSAGLMAQVEMSRAGERRAYVDLNAKYTKLATDFQINFKPDEQNLLRETILDITVAERKLAGEGVSPEGVVEEVNRRFLSRLTKNQRQFFDEYTTLNREHAIAFNETIDNLLVLREAEVIPKNFKIPERVNIRQFHSPIVYEGDWMLITKHSDPKLGGKVEIATREELLKTAKALVKEGGLSDGDRLAMVPRFMNEDTAADMLPRITDDIEAMFGGSILEWRKFLQEFKGNTDQLQTAIFSGNKQWTGKASTNGALHFLNASYMRAVQATRFNAHAFSAASLETIKANAKKIDSSGVSFRNLIDGMENIINDVMGRRGNIEGQFFKAYKRWLNTASATSTPIGALLNSSAMQNLPDIIPRVMTRFTRIALLGFNLKTAFVNSTTAFINVGGHVGIPETVQAMSRLVARKVDDNGIRLLKSAEDDWLRSVGIKLDYAGFAHLDAAKETSAKWLKGLSKRSLEEFEHYAMLPFQTTEDWTHAVAAVASRLKTEKSILKFKRIAAGETGVKLNQWDRDFFRFAKQLKSNIDSDNLMSSWVRHQRNQTTGNFDKAVLPELFRSGPLRPATQFKSFWNHQLQFLFGHEAFGSGGVGLAWRDPVRFMYSMGVMASFGGLMALPGMEVIEWAGQGIYGTSPKLWLERSFSDFVNMGLPTLMGVDISQTLQFGDMLPISTGQLSAAEFGMGVFGSRALDFTRAFLRNKNTIMTAIVNRDGDAMAEVLRRMNPAMPIMWQQAYNAYNLGFNNEIPSSFDVGRPKVSGDDISGFLPNLAVFAGFPTVQEKKFTRMLKATQLMNKHDQNKRSQAYNLAFKLERVGRFSDAQSILRDHDISTRQWKVWKTKALKPRDKSLESRIMLQNRDEVRENLRELDGIDFRTDLEDDIANLFR